MDIKNSLKNYHNFFENKVASSTGIDHFGWRALQITTGIFCYPILGLISSISSLASKIFSKISDENGTSALESKNVKHIDRKTQIDELKDKIETLPKSKQSEHWEELEKLDSTEEAEQAEMMKQAVIKQLRIKELNKKLDDALLEIKNPLANFEEADLEHKIEELEQLKKELQEVDSPSNEKIDQSIQEIKHQIAVKQLNKKLVQEYNGIVFSNDQIFVAHLNEKQLKDKLDALNNLKKESENLNAPVNRLMNPIIEVLEDHLAFIQEIKKAGEIIEEDGKALLNLGENPEERISPFRHDINLMKLYHEIRHYRQEKGANENLKRAPEHRLKRSVAKAKFAYHLGIQTKSPSTGVHATFFLRSTTGKKLGVFKTADLRVDPIRGFFRDACALINIGQELLLNKGKYVQLAGEKAAYIIKQKMDEFGPLDFELAPVTLMTLENLSGTEDVGAFLLFCKNVKLAEEVLTSLNKNMFDKQELVRCHAAFLYDFLLGNLDRHTRNYMMGVSNQDKIEKILLIDNSNILPTQEPSLINHTANKARFVWKDLKVAQYPIPEEVRAIFIKILEAPDQFVENIFNEINKDPEIVALFSADRVETPALQNQMRYFSDESKEAMKKRAIYLKDAIRNSQASLQQIAAGFVT